MVSLDISMSGRFTMFASGVDFMSIFPSGILRQLTNAQ